MPDLPDETANAAAVAFVNVSSLNSETVRKEAFARSFLSYFLWGSAGEMLAKKVLKLRKNSKVQVVSVKEEQAKQDGEEKEVIDITLAVKARGRLYKIALELKVGAPPTREQIKKYVRINNHDLVVLVVPESKLGDAKKAVDFNAAKQPIAMTWSEVAEVTELNEIASLVKYLQVPKPPRDLPARWWKSEWADEFLAWEECALQAQTVVNETVGSTGYLTVSTYKDNPRFWIASQKNILDNRDKRWYLILEFDPTDPDGSVVLFDTLTGKKFYVGRNFKEPALRGLVERETRMIQAYSGGEVALCKWGSANKSAPSDEFVFTSSAVWNLLFALQHLEMRHDQMMDRKSRRMSEDGIPVGRFLLDFERLRKGEFPLLFEGKPLEEHHKWKHLIDEAAKLSSGS